MWHRPHCPVPVPERMPNLVRWATCSDPNGVGLFGSSKNRGWQLTQPLPAPSSYIGYASTRTTPATSTRPTSSVRRYLKRVPSIWTPSICLVIIKPEPSPVPRARLLDSALDYYRPHDEYVNKKVDE